MAGTMSGGEQQMLAISRALVTRPHVLFLDELSMGLAPLIVAELYDLVGKLSRQGMTIVLVEQFVTTALAVADHAAIMVHGRIEQQGTPGGHGRGRAQHRPDQLGDVGPGGRRVAGHGRHLVGHRRGPGCPRCGTAVRPPPPPRRLTAVLRELPLALERRHPDLEADDGAEQPVDVRPGGVVGDTGGRARPRGCR